jgi:hypothetical protein
MKTLLALTFAALACTTAAAQEHNPPEPKVQRTVIEDDSVRIEELRVRGLSTSLVVKPKHAAQYEVVPAPGGRALAADAPLRRVAAGQRVWNVLKF